MIYLYMLCFPLYTYNFLSNRHSTLGHPGRHYVGQGTYDIPLYVIFFYFYTLDEIYVIFFSTFILLMKYVAMRY
jgi:hypothetical protein